MAANPHPPRIGTDLAVRTLIRAIESIAGANGSTW